MTTIVCTARSDLLDLIRTAAAAAGVAVKVTGDPDEVTSQQTLIAGVDLAEPLARRQGWGERRVLLVGGEADAEQLCAWSGPLSATVVALPEGVHWLSQVLAGGAGSTGRTIAVIGGCGGIGASTFAAGLAGSAAGAGVRTALVDLDDLGGGLDLLLGAERLPGWRWPDLAAAKGWVGDLTEQLPSAERVTLLSHDRHESAQPSAGAVQAVLRSLARVHDLVIVDTGRQLSEGVEEALRLSDGALLLGGPEIRPVSAAARLLADLEPSLAVGLVLQRGRRGGLEGAAVAHALGVSLVGELPFDKRLQSAGSSAQAPHRLAGRGWRTACADLAERLLPEPR